MQAAGLDKSPSSGIHTAAAGASASLSEGPSSSSPPVIDPKSVIAPTTGRGWGAGRRALQVVDCHAGGEPARVVVGGLPHVPGSSMNAKRERMRDEMDSLRKLLLHEPRGYPCQNANFVLPPTDPAAAFGFVIAEQGRIYPMMSGHNAICVA